jgi:hypothetical protein
MALFIKQYIASQLPNEYKHLHMQCTRHILPMRMQFSRWTRTPDGFPIAEFHCHGCMRTIGMGRDHDTGKPRRIYEK